MSTFTLLSHRLTRRETTQLRRVSHLHTPRLEGAVRDCNPIHFMADSAHFFLTILLAVRPVCAPQKTEWCSYTALPLVCQSKRNQM